MHTRESGGMTTGYAGDGIFMNTEFANLFIVQKDRGNICLEKTRQFLQREAQNLVYGRRGCGKAGNTP
jgi:hypothetical protein